MGSNANPTMLKFLNSELEVANMIRSSVPCNVEHRMAKNKEEKRYYNLVWFGLVACFATGLLSLLEEPPNAADHGATICLGIASPKP